SCRCCKHPARVKYTRLVRPLPWTTRRAGDVHLRPGALEEPQADSTGDSTGCTAAGPRKIRKIFDCFRRLLLLDSVSIRTSSVVCRLDSRCTALVARPTSVPDDIGN